MAGQEVFSVELTFVSPLNIDKMDVRLICIHLSSLPISYMYPCVCMYIQTYINI